MPAAVAQTALSPGEVARRVFDCVIARDPDAIVRFSAPDEHADFVAVREFVGPDELRRFFAEVFAAFPDFDMAVDQIISDEHTAVVQWHTAGTFTGAPFLGIVPTGKRATLKGVDVMEVADGLIRRNTIYYDGATLARQIGLLPDEDSLGYRALLTMFNTAVRARRLVAAHKRPDLARLPRQGHRGRREAPPAGRRAGGQKHSNGSDPDLTE